MHCTILSNERYSERRFLIYVIIIPPKNKQGDYNMENILTIKRKHAIYNEQGKRTGGYTVSVECLSGQVSNTEIQVLEDINIVSIQGFGNLKRKYDCSYHENIVLFKERETHTHSYRYGEHIEKSFEVDTYIETIFLNGQKIFDIEWCSDVWKKRWVKLYKKQGESEWKLED